METLPNALLNAEALACLQDQRTLQWHIAPPGAILTAMPPTLENLVEAQHSTNFNLWHAEDEARRPDARDTDLAAIKRQIDRVNQQRNDTTEHIDSLLLERLNAAPAGEQHSETPGMILDRLSILSLRLYHTREEIERADAPAGHRERNTARLAILETQRADLLRCLDHLWTEICAGRRHFKQYRQLKMYNDPELNPVIYQSQRGQHSGS